MNRMLAGILPQEGGLEASVSGKYAAAIGLFGLLTLVGVGAGIHSLYAGHEHTFGVSREVPWGILIAAYVFFVVTSTGLCIVSSIGHVFGFKNFNPIAKRAVFMSIATIVAGFLVIAFEIENSWRMPVGNVIGANATSNIWWMGTLYGAYLFFMLIEFVMLQKNDHKKATAFGLAGLLTGVAAHSNLGAVFGLLNAREFWHGPYMPIYFITSAAMSGCIAIIFFTWLAYRANNWRMSEEMKKSMESVAKVGALMMAVIIFFTCWKMISGVSGNPPGKYEAIMALVTGPYALNFWGGEVALGMVYPVRDHHAGEGAEHERAVRGGAGGDGGDLLHALRPGDRRAAGAALSRDGAGRLCRFPELYAVAAREPGGDGWRRLLPDALPDGRKAVPRPRLGRPLRGSVPGSGGR